MVFKKGNIPWSKGRKIPKEVINKRLKTIKDRYGKLTAWNKGLTKETDKRVNKYAKTKLGEKRPYLSEKYKGEGNPNFKNGIITGKRMMLEINRVCEECNSNKNLEVHHIDRDRSNNILENLKVVCKSCHSKIHRGNREWYSHMIKFKQEIENERILC